MPAMFSMAFWRFLEASSSPRALMTLARRSRSASACLAIARFMSAGSSMSWILIEVTSIPQLTVSLSTRALISSASFWRSVRRVSNSTPPITSRRAGWAYLVVAFV